MAAAACEFFRKTLFSQHCYHLKESFVNLATARCFSEVDVRIRVEQIGEPRVAAIQRKMMRSSTQTSLALFVIPMLIHPGENQTSTVLPLPGDTGLPAIVSTTAPDDSLRDQSSTTIESPYIFTNDTELNLDDVLAAVNKTETPATLPPPTVTNYGDRLYMHQINNNYNKEDLMGHTLRILVPKLEPPYVNYVNFTDAEAILRGYTPGVVMEILKEFKKQLNLTFVLVESLDDSWGSYEKGNWTGAFGQMYRKEADILAGAAIMQYDRSLITDLTYPFQYAPTGMLIRAPDKFTDNTWLIVTQPFKWEVWGMTAASIAISGVVLTILTRCLRVADELHFTLVDSLWVFFSIFVQQGLPQQPRSWTCRVMLALWWLASITLMANFTGRLVALFAVERITMPFNDINQLVSLVQRGKWRIIMDGTSITRTNMIKDSETAVYKKLWYEISVNRRASYVKGIEAGVALLLSSANMVLLGPEDSLRYEDKVNCQLKKLEEGILPTYLSIPLMKDSPYSTYLSNLIRDLVERGFVEKWISDYTNYMASKRVVRCNATSDSDQKYLDLSKSQGAFWVLVTGVSLAIAFLILEFGYRKLRELFVGLRRSGKIAPDGMFSARSKKSSSDSVSASSESTGHEPEVVKPRHRAIHAFRPSASMPLSQPVIHDDPLDFQRTRF